MKYQHFEDFVFRTAMLPIMPMNPEMLKDSVVKEAIFLASPDLSAQSEQATRQEKNERKTGGLSSIDFALYKYLSRMSSRCTPFGLFAGCGTGTFSSELPAGIVFDGLKNCRSNTRLDMNYLCELIQHITGRESIRPLLRYFSNTSLYRLGDVYRYVEYTFEKNKRKYQLSEIEHDYGVETILNASENGATFKELVDLLRDDYSEEEIESFIQSLIDSQVLVSELSPGVTGTDLLDSLISKLETIGAEPELHGKLVCIKHNLVELDGLAIGNRMDLYQRILSEVKDLGVKFDQKFLFQSDLAVFPQKSHLHHTLAEQVKEAVTVLNKFTPREDRPSLKKFREAFYEKYEEEEVPLLEVLDADIGIGFGNQTPGQTDIHPLIDSIVPLTISDMRPKYSATDLLMYEKFIRSREEKSMEIVLTEEDLKKLPDVPADFPATFSVMIELVTCNPEDDNLKFYFRSMGGSSAANLLGRFGHIDPSIQCHLLNITKKEKEIYGDTKILAEIVHLPEARIGNILFRPAIRQYEIPYLGSSSVDTEFQIPLSDLMVSVKSGREIVLRSKKLNKEVIPRLATAHNFSNSTLPVYSFLCTLQIDKVKSGVFFSWGPLVGQQKFLPRVTYGKCILFSAIWQVSADEVKAIPETDAQDFYEKVLQLKDKRNLPDFGFITKGDNKLLINFHDPISVQCLFMETKKNGFSIEEAHFRQEAGVVLSPRGTHTNELIFSYYKQTETNDK